MNTKSIYSPDQAHLRAIREEYRQIGNATKIDGDVLTVFPSWDDRYLTTNSARSRRKREEEKAKRAGRGKRRDED